MDISEAAARKLVITHAGLKRLTVTKVSSKSESAKASPAPSSTAPAESNAPAESTADAVSLPDPPN